MENLRNVNVMLAEDILAVSSATAKFIADIKDSQSGLNEEFAKVNYLANLKESDNATNELREANIAILFALLKIE